MNIPIIPLQKSGILSAGAASIALLLALVWQIALPGDHVLDPVAALEDLPTTLLFLAALVCVGVSFVSGLVAVLRDREYALTVFLAIIISAFGLVYSIWSLVASLAG